MTQVSVRVNGPYRATIRAVGLAGMQTLAVDGDKEGGREHVFTVEQGQDFTLRVTEEPLTDAMKANRPASTN